MPIRGARQPGDRHSRDRRTPGWSGSHSLRDFLRNRSEAEENTTRPRTLPRTPSERPRRSSATSPTTTSWPLRARRIRALRDKEGRREHQGHLQQVGVRTTGDTKSLRRNHFGRPRFGHVPLERQGERRTMTTQAPPQHPASALPRRLIQCSSARRATPRSPTRWSRRSQASPPAR